MKTKHQSLPTLLSLLSLFVLIQGCGFQQRLPQVRADYPIFSASVQSVQSALDHHKDCPVVATTRSTFFEENEFQPELPVCAYCHQRCSYTNTALSKTH